MDWPYNKMGVKGQVGEELKQDGAETGFTVLVCYFYTYLKFSIIKSFF